MNETERFSSTLTNRQTRTIAVLVRARTVEEGAKMAGLSKTTIYAWLRLPAFREELARQKNQLMDVALGNLKSVVEKAVSVLTSLLDSQSEAIRRGVANDVLGHALRGRELEELDGRLAKLEELVEAGRQRRRMC
jgi:hypothetical protein